MSENCVVTPDGCLRGTVVVIQHATDPLATANRSWADCSIKRLNQLVTDTLMVPLGMVVGDEFGYRATKRRCRSPNRIMRSRHSSLIDRTNRSAYALQLGARNGVRMIRTPSCSRNSSTPRPVSYTHLTLPTS